MVRKNSNPKKTRPFLRIRIEKWGRKKVLRTLGIIILLGIAASLGAGFGAFLAVRQNLPSVSELETFESNIITSIYSDEGQPIKDFAIERRVEVGLDRIPDVLRKAIIATEDPRFYRHRGVDLRGILRAFRDNILSGRLLRRPQGRSTITQQLARLLFLYPSRPSAGSSRRCTFPPDRKAVLQRKKSWRCTATSSTSTMEFTG
jgi:penicillin-binding protein 1A